MTYRHNQSDAGPYEEEYRGFEIRDDETARGPLILTLAIGVLIVFAAVVWNTYRQGVRPQDGALPMVVAEAQPYKRVPDDRGGVQIDDLDRQLYNIMDGSEGAVRQAARQVSGTSDGLLRGGPPTDLRPQSSQGNVAPETPPALPDAESAVDEPGPGEIAAEALPSLPEPEQRPAQAETETEAPVQTAAAEPEPEPASRFAFHAGGSYVVQISALRSEPAATDAWQKTRRSYPDIFEGASMSIERADLGARGVFYRLRAGAFGSRETASDFCNAYKAEGGDCIVVRNTA